MSYSIEARSPFMDREQFRYLSLPAAQKFRGGFNKFMLRKMFDFTGKSETQWRRQKQGFRYRPDYFVAANRAQIIDYIAGHNYTNETCASIPIDVLQREDVPYAMLVKLLAIAAAARALDGRR